MDFYCLNLRLKFTIDILPPSSPPQKGLILARNSKLSIDQACVIFLESTWYKDPKDTDPWCQTCKYTNTNANTQIQLLWKLPLAPTVLIPGNI